MANIRRVVRKVEPSAARYVEEQLWPIWASLIVLGGFLVGMNLVYLPLSGVAWQRTAWPSVIGVPLVIAAAMAAMALVDNRLFRRSLQLSLVLCAILHVALVVHMLQTDLLSGILVKGRADLAIVPNRPRKIVPEYHPTQLVPEEDRPRQDFEKPVETETPQPSPEPEQIVRQPSEQERSPTLAQPVPIPREQPTIEPNVVHRNVPNEAAPRLAANTSRLSRQLEPSKSRQSQVVDVPSAVPQSLNTAEAQPSAARIEREASEAAKVARQPAQPMTKAASTTAQATRKMNADAPKSEAVTANSPQRALANAREAQSTPISAVESPAAQPQPTAADLRASATNTSRQKTAVAQSQITSEPKAELRERADAPSATKARSSKLASAPNVEPNPIDSAVQRRSVSSAPGTATSVAVTSPTASAASAANREQAAQPSKLALNHGESGTVGGRRSLNLDTSLPGAASPALAASSAARRAEATQRSPAGDALSPSATARLARSRSGAETPSASVKAEQLERATTPGAAQVAEVTASSGAGLTRSDAAARHDAVTGAKGLGEIDFGPTQIVMEAGSGRMAGGGQPNVNLAPSVARPSRTVPAGPNGGEARVAASEAGGPASQVAAHDSTPTAEVEAASVAAARLQEQTEDAGARPSPTSGVQAGEVRAVSFSEPASGGLAARARVEAEVESLDGTRSVPTTDGGPARAALAGPTLREGNVVAVPEVGPRSAVAQADLDHVGPGAGPASVKRGGNEALAIDIVAALGPGGLGTDFSPDVGINTRQGREDSIDVQLRSARFVRAHVGGLPAVSAAAVVPAEAYSSRAARVRGDERSGGRGSNSPQTEEAIERGLAFLARYQAADGGWSLQGFPEGASLVSDTAATALAVLAFQGAGYNHREFQYRDVLRAGLASLLKSQKENGDLFVPLDDESNKSVWLYSHSLAAIAICEAYGMTQDPALRGPAQKALDFVVSGQNADRGGWRYAPGIGADTSVSGWMMMALKSGELAGLEVPATTYRRIEKWLDGAQQSRSEPHLYRYNPSAPDTSEQRHGRTASKTMTAVGLLMRLYSGWEKDDANMLRGAAYLGTSPPAIGTSRDPQRDTYYWYYATQVMSHVGGETWQAWIARLHPLLIDSQVRQGPYGGSWDPKSPVADRWGPHAGRIYVTAMNLLSLEVQYRKLPLYGHIVSGQ